MWVPYVVSGCLQIFTTFSCGAQLLFQEGSCSGRAGGGGTSFSEPNGDVPLDGVAFSIELLEWGRTFSDFGGKKVLHIYG